MLAQAEFGVDATELSPGTCPRTLPLSSHVAISKSLVLCPEVPVVKVQPQQAPTFTPPMCPSLLKMSDEADKTRAKQKPPLGAFVLLQDQILDKASLMWNNP